jgi:hypothetical protein
MRFRLLIAPVTMALMTSALVMLSAQTAGAVTRAGTSSPQTGDFTPSGTFDVTQVEFPGQLDKEGQVEPAIQRWVRRAEPVPAALCARWEPVHRRAA